MQQALSTVILLLILTNKKLMTLNTVGSICLSVGVQNVISSYSV